MEILLLILVLVVILALAASIAPTWSARRPRRRVMEDVNGRDPVVVEEVVEEEPIAERPERRRIVEY